MSEEGLKKRLANIEPYKYKPGQCGNPNGRPKNRVNKYLLELLPREKAKVLKQELTRCEINTIERQVLQLELADLQLIAKAEKTPAYLKTLALAIIVDMKNGKTTTVDRLRDRQYGAAKQELEVSSSLSFAEMLIETGMAKDVENGQSQEDE